MKEYQYKPRVVLARQWTPDDSEIITYEGFKGHYYWHVDMSVDDTQILEPGDWLITEDGRNYTMSDDQFNDTFTLK